jgi:hypothetical protein
MTPVRYLMTLFNTTHLQPRSNKSMCSQINSGLFAATSPEIVNARKITFPVRTFCPPFLVKSYENPLFTVNKGDVARFSRLRILERELCVFWVGPSYCPPIFALPETLDRGN